jgi:hypothetical protein
MDLQKVGWEGMDRIVLAQDWGRWRALVNAELNLPSSIKCGKIFDNLRDS